MNAEIEQVINEIKESRSYYEDYFLVEAQAIADEVKEAIEKCPETQLGHYKRRGYRADVGCPHQWWYDSCRAYREASYKYLVAKHFHTVCILADALLLDVPERD